VFASVREIHMVIHRLRREILYSDTDNLMSSSTGNILKTLKNTLTITSEITPDFVRVFIASISYWRFFENCFADLKESFFEGGIEVDSKLTIVPRRETKLCKDNFAIRVFVMFIVYVHFCCLPRGDAAMWNGCEFEFETLL
jgi:hypothetical protein